MRDLPAPAPAATARLPWVRAAAFGTVLAGALWPRLTSWRVLFARGELMQWDGDSAYHLKRILHALAHFPGLPRFDPSMSWPDGAPCPWPDGFDLLAAGWGLGAGLGDPGRARMAVLLFTPIVALLVIWAAMDLARLVVPAGPAHEGAVLAAGILTGLLPSGIVQSQAGYLDHHVVELLAFLLLAGWALRRLPRATRHAAPGVAWELGGALAATFALWVFSGGVLYVAIAAAILLWALLRDERPPLVGSGVPALAIAAAASALLTLPALRAHGRAFTYQFPSLVQPMLVAGAAAGLGVALLATRAARGTGRRLALLCAGGLAFALVAAVALPTLARETRAGLEGWLLLRDPWIASVAEFQPLGFGRPSVWWALYRSFGALGVASPLILLLGGWVAIREDGPRGVAFTALSALFVLLTLRQLRFERIGQPLLVICAAAALAAVAQRRLARAQGLAASAFPVLAAGVLVLADPALREAIAPDWLRVPPEAMAAVALRERAGPSAGSEGVLTSWDQGHLVALLSGLPTATNGFGSYLDAAAFREAEGMFRKDGDALDRFLERRRLRWVVAGAFTDALARVDGRIPFRFARDGNGTLDLDYMRGSGLSPLVIGGSAIPGSGVRHLERLMPVYGTPSPVPGLSFGLPALWIYERVAGARLVGRARPGERVVASLPFREQQRPHVWRAFADAGPDGRFALTVPLPSRLVAAAFSTGPAYSLSAGTGRPVEVSVPEEAVRAGASIDVGDLARRP